MNMMGSDDVGKMKIEEGGKLIKEGSGGENKPMGLAQQRRPDKRPAAR